MTEIWTAEWPDFADNLDGLLATPPIGGAAGARGIRQARGRGPGRARGSCDAFGARRHRLDGSG